MTITLGVADPGACWLVAAATCHGGGNPSIKKRARIAIKNRDHAQSSRQDLSSQRQQVDKALGDLKSDRAKLKAKGKKIETEAAPIRYVAELMGAETDSERAIRWLIALMVLCCDPLAIALIAAASVRRCPDAHPNHSL
jgi:hypothetical protein